MTETDVGRINWVASYPKSGNTWIRKLVDAYIMGCIDLNSLRHSLVLGDTWIPAMQAVCPWPLEDAARGVLVLCRPAALCNILANAGTEDVFLKTHSANVTIQEVPMIPGLLTRAAVYVVRDPRDVAISWSHHAEVGFDEAITQLNCKLGMIHDAKRASKFAWLGSWRHHVASWLGCKRFPVTKVRYEDLLVDPEKEFRRVLATFGFIDVDEVRLRFALEETTFEKLRGMEDVDGFKEKQGGDHFFRCGKKEQWRAFLSEDQVKAIESVQGDVMKSLGYELEYGPTGKSKELEKVACAS